MNKTQLARWRRFSDGLAAKAHPSITPSGRNKLRDEVAEFIDILTGSYALSEINDWDGNGDSICVSDEMSRFMWDRRYEQERRVKGDCEYVVGRFGNMLGACSRAGFDVAVAPSAGVVGFTVGDVRAIFPRGLPGWVNDYFHEPITPRTPASHGVWL